MEQLLCPCEAASKLIKLPKSFESNILQFVVLCSRQLLWKFDISLYKILIWHIKFWLELFKIYCAAVWFKHIWPLLLSHFLIKDSEKLLNKLDFSKSIATLIYAFAISDANDFLGNSIFLLFSLGLSNKAHQYAHVLFWNNSNNWNI